LIVCSTTKIFSRGRAEIVARLPEINSFYQEEVRSFY